MNFICKTSLCLFFFFSITISTLAVSFSDGEIWKHLEKGPLDGSLIENRVLPTAYQSIRLDRLALAAELKKAPTEFTSARPLIVSLPMPDGSPARFSVEHSPIVEPGLAAKYPEITHTYSARGIDDPLATARFDLMPSGFHAIIISTRGTVYIQPFEAGDAVRHISFYHKDAPPEWFALDCGVSGSESGPAFGGVSVPSAATGQTLRTFRLAVAATAEYTQAYGGGSVSNTLSAITTTINLVNAVYERESAIRMVLVANESSVIFTDAATDGYTHDNANAMLAENQAKLDAVIGNASYDIGHVFDGTLLTTGGFSFQGVAVIGDVCVSTTKGRGVDIFRSVSPSNVVAYYSTAHEMGHQFGATHMMNGSLTGCGGARTASSAFEPGSGTTIMGYRYNCGTQDMQSTDTYFNVFNLDQIAAFTTTGAGTCAAQTATGNGAPVVSAGDNYTIPKLTPFALTATATDPNGDAISYTWEEADLGPASPPDTDADGQARPIFRSYLGTPNPTRSFPSLTYILNNANTPPATGQCPLFGSACLIGEALPTITRAMNFRVTARDSRPVGGVNSASTRINIDGNSGPFIVTSPNSQATYAGNSRQTVTWDVAGTNNAPVSVGFVKISFSNDGGNTSPFVLAASTANDGSEMVIIPNGNTSTARIKIEAVNNVFF